MVPGVVLGAGVALLVAGVAGAVVGGCCGGGGRLLVAGVAGGAAVPVPGAGVLVAGVAGVAIGGGVTSLAVVSIRGEAAAAASSVPFSSSKITRHSWSTEAGSAFQRARISSISQSLGPCCEEAPVAFTPPL